MGPEWHTRWLGGFGCGVVWVTVQQAELEGKEGAWVRQMINPHSVPSKVSKKVGSVMCWFIPAPRGTGIVAAPASKRLLQLAGVSDCYTQSKGSTATMGNFLKATFAAVCARN